MAIKKYEPSLITVIKHLASIEHTYYNEIVFSFTKCASKMETVRPPKHEVFVPEKKLKDRPSLWGKALAFLLFRQEANYCNSGGCHEEA